MAQTTETPRRHAAVWSAALTFTLGLAAVRALLGHWLGARLAPPAFTWGDPLLVLTLICSATTLLYLFVRREEGDFQALFLLSLLLFVLQELCLYLNQVCALKSFEDFGLPVSFAVSVYCLLGFSAAVYDGPVRRGDRTRWCLLTANGVILALAVLRAFGTMGHGGGRIPERWAYGVGLGLLAAAAVFLLCVLVWGALQRSVPSGGPASAGETPPDAAQAPPAEKGGPQA